MDEATLQALMREVAGGTVDPDDAVRRLRRLPFADLGFARIDHHRHLRQGFPEAVYGPGKTPEHCAAVIGELLTTGSGPVVLTRADEAQIAACRAVAEPDVQRGATLTWRPHPVPAGERATVAVLTAGTADLAVADECATVLEAHGIGLRRLDDVGVAGLHRLLAGLDQLEDLEVAVVVAGMEGALASVIGGLVGAPVIAVPTSVGYGAGLQGVTALLAMLSSCASGVTVVGIDNGFGAACAVLRQLATNRRRFAPSGFAGTTPPTEPTNPTDPTDPHRPTP